MLRYSWVCFAWRRLKVQRLKKKQDSPTGSSEGRVYPAQLPQCLPAQHPGLQSVSQPPDSPPSPLWRKDLLLSAHFTCQLGQQVSQKSRLSPILPPSCLLMTQSWRITRNAAHTSKVSPITGQAGTGPGEYLWLRAHKQPTLQKDQLLQKLNLSPADLQLPVMSSPNML